VPAHVNGKGAVVWTASLKAAIALLIALAGLVGTLAGRIFDDRYRELDRRLVLIEDWKEQGGRWTIRQQAAHQRDMDQQLHLIDKRLARLEGQ
jgi:hypothetical protein